MIASLGMYDMPAIQTANDLFWQAIRARLGRGPRALTRGGSIWEIWQSPELLLAQTCGMPYRTRLHGQVALVGTPDYGLPDCPPGYYRSVLIVPREGLGATLADFAGGTFAYNEALSQSGWAAPMTHFAALGLRPSRLLQTGSHAASVQAVAEGRADLAAIDALTWELLCEHDPAAARCRVIARTEPTPGLPYITARAHDPAPLAAAVRAAIADLPGTARAALHLSGLAVIAPEAYLAIPTPPAP